MQILALNGPPRCGKDTVAGFVDELTFGRAFNTKFAACLKEATHALFDGLASREPDLHMKPHDAYEKVKDEARIEFFGLTPREAYILVSEALIKPAFSTEFFGDRMVDRIDRESAIRVSPVKQVVISDSGFASELVPLIERYGAETITVIRINRIGCDFSNDSRSFVRLEDLAEGVKIFNIGNNGSLEDLRQTTIGLLMRENWLSADSAPRTV